MSFQEALVCKLTLTHTLARHVLMRRKTDRTRQHKDRSQQLCRLSFTILPMIEATHSRVSWVGRICRYMCLIRPPFPHLGVASLAQVSKTGLCLGGWGSGCRGFPLHAIGRHVQAFAHTHMPGKVPQCLTGASGGRKEMSSSIASSSWSSSVPSSGDWVLSPAHVG